jgi:hypothetical protein
MAGRKTTDIEPHGPLLLNTSDQGDDATAIAKATPSRRLSGEVS